MQDRVVISQLQVTSGGRIHSNVLRCCCSGSQHRMRSEYSSSSGSPRLAIASVPAHPSFYRQLCQHEYWTIDRSITVRFSAKEKSTVHNMSLYGQSMAANQEDLSTDSHERKSHHRYRAAGTRKRLSSKFLPCSTRNTLDRCQICCAITPALASASWCQRRETTGISVLPDSINSYPLVCQGSHCLPATKL